MSVAYNKLKLKLTNYNNYCEISLYGLKFAVLKSKSSSLTVICKAYE